MDENPSFSSSPVNLESLAIYQAYLDSPYLSIKHEPYFPAYEELLGKFKGRNVILVEIGVLNGGSLFMWRNFLGENARIIGIDLNPDAKKWEEHGFEIHIGNQSDPKFWEAFFEKVRIIDVLIDDGGHTNRQQIVTVVKCLPHISDKGMLIIEDTHTSYMKTFGNPSRYSFINFSKHIIDSVHSRSSVLNKEASKLSKKIESITFYESLVAIKVNSSIPIKSQQTSNFREHKVAIDFREVDQAGLKNRRLREILHKILPSIYRTFPLARNLLGAVALFNFRLRNRELKKYW